MSSKKRTPMKPATVSYVENIIRTDLAKSRRIEIIRNAKLPRGHKFLPQSIREYWDNRLYVYWDDYREAWVLCDNFEEGIPSLIFYPASERWTHHRDFADWESELTHERAAAIAENLYKITQAGIPFFEGVHYYTAPRRAK